MVNEVLHTILLRLQQIDLFGKVGRPANLDLHLGIEPLIYTHYAASCWRDAIWPRLVPIFVKQDLRCVLGVHVELFELLLCLKRYHVICYLVSRLHWFERRHIF